MKISNLWNHLPYNQNFTFRPNYYFKLGNGKNIEYSNIMKILIIFELKLES